jgi:hypothetical protein
VQQLQHQEMLCVEVHAVAGAPLGTILNKLLVKGHAVEANTQLSLN